MTGYIGPLGPESLDAAQQVILSWAYAGEPADVGSARPVLSAAVSAVDREAWAERFATILKEHGVKATARTVTYGDAHGRYRANIAQALVADLFPTEGEAEQ